MITLNPSANGWIDKLFTERSLQQPLQLDPEAFYTSLRRTGFLYGHVVNLCHGLEVNTDGWIEDEFSKAALLLALFDIYRLTIHRVDPVDFVIRALEFYKTVNPGATNLLKKVLPGGSGSARLEELISERVRTNHDVVSKNFTNIVTNALLFIDVLAFRRFLSGELADDYFQKIEESVISIVTLALAAKTVKSAHDDLLLKLFQTSLRYTKFSKSGIKDPEQLKLSDFTDPLEKFYFIDMGGLALWSDGEIENEEAYFLYKLSEIMGVDDAFTARSIIDTHHFLSKYKKQIPYFNHSSPVKSFYDHMTQMVVTLMTRNRKRLVKEISQSAELMSLLAQSTQRELDAREKKKVKRQMIDIIKSIPSLTIFLLPGGSLLLPILIRFIPTLLPSAFNENQEQE